jgi:hypothetical protein
MENLTMRLIDDWKAQVLRLWSVRVIGSGNA